MTSRRYHTFGRGRPFPNIDFLASLRPTRMKLGLENISRLLEGLGNPHTKFPAILVGGTNGKGSVTTFISSILRSGGMRVGTFYSPHLFRINERIRFNGEEIPSAVLDEILGRLRMLYDKSSFTFFEGITAAAILYFVRRNVDIAVFEVGLGGRLDATRLVNAVVTVITGISLDHREHLGKTRGAILNEKLGIARKEVPLIANLNSKVLRKRASLYCRSEGVPFYDVRDEARADIVSLEPARMRLRLATCVRDYGELETRMIGRFQAANIATAVRTVEALRDTSESRDLPEAARHGKRGELKGRPVTSGKVKRIVSPAIASLESVKAGIGSAFIAGRFQVLAGAPRVILDVSHNEEALLAALETLRRISPRERSALIFGVMLRKELGKFPGKAICVASNIILTSLKDRGSSKGKRLHDLFYEACPLLERERVNIFAARGMAHAVRAAKRLLRPEDTLLILGSHIAVEEAAAYL
jgi:dihydrofolate synthase/folylpolyglutamate synthase